MWEMFCWISLVKANQLPPDGFQSLLTWIRFEILSWGEYLPVLWPQPQSLSWIFILHVFSSLGGLCVCLRISHVSLFCSSVLLNSEIRFIISLKSHGVLRNLSHIHCRQKAGNLCFWKVSVGLSQSNSFLHMFSQPWATPGAEACRHDLSYSYLRHGSLPGEPHVAGKREREEMRRCHQNTGTWKLWLLSQKTEWARAVSFLKKGIVLGLSPIYVLLSSLLFSSVSPWLGQNTPQKCVWTSHLSHALLLKKQPRVLHVSE